ncbi:MAG: hypothetical protein GY797_27030 [Deltaproteobacteria bacterium]|nr:hypothetical protein [Deltaproteobacteria bacterium]
MRKQLAAATIGMFMPGMAILSNAFMAITGTVGVWLRSNWVSSFYKTFFFLMLVVTIFSTGCSSLSYSVVDHQPFSIEGSSSIKGVIANDWECYRVSLFPATEYGLAVVNNDIRAVNPKYSDIVRSVPVADKTFVFKNLPSGKYILKCTVTRGEWITGGQMAQRNSPIALGSISRGKPLTLETSYGTFYRDAHGNWEPPGVMVRRSEEIRETLGLSDGQRQVISIPLP